VGIDSTDMLVFVVVVVVLYPSVSQNIRRLLSLTLHLKTHPVYEYVPTPAVMSVRAYKEYEPPAVYSVGSNE